jgi:hypothetical protein
VRQDTSNDNCELHPVGFGGDGLGNGPPLDAVVALGVRIAAEAVTAQRARTPLNNQHNNKASSSSSNDDEAEDEEN